MRPSLPAVLLLAACQAPFDADRHDLLGDRIVTILAEPAGGLPGDTLEVSAPRVVDGALWSDEPVDLAWIWLTGDVYDASADDADAIGPSPTLTLPEAPATLGLIATFPSGAERRAVLSLSTDGARTAERPTGVILAVVDDWTAETATEDDLEIEARRAASATAAAAVPSSAFARLEATFGESPASRVRWMATGGDGHFLELDAARTDWAAADLTMDDLEIETSVPAPPGPRSLVVLTVDDQGANALFTTELFVGDAQPGVRVADRWMQADPLPDAGWAVATLTADDQAPTGLRLTDVGASAGPGEPWGTADIPCAPADQPFDPDWLFQGRCTRAELVGARVRIEVTP